jgi:hypothetical protein
MSEQISNKRYLKVILLRHIDVPLRPFRIYFNDLLLCILQHYKLTSLCGGLRVFSEASVSCFFVHWRTSHVSAVFSLVLHGPFPGHIFYCGSERFSRLISEPVRSIANAVAWPHSLENPYSERPSQLISGPGRSRPRFSHPPENPKVTN